MHEKLNRKLIAIFALAIKLATHILLETPRPKITLASLSGWRYVPFLLTSLAEVDTVGVRWRDAGRALKFLPFESFLFRVVISDWLPIKSRGVLLRDCQIRYCQSNECKCERQAILRANYYEELLFTNKNVYVLPYFAHPLYYTHSLFKYSKLLSLTDNPKKRLLFFSGTSNTSYRCLLDKFNLSNRHELISLLVEYLNIYESSELKNRSKILITIGETDAMEKHPMSQKEYITALSESDFCLCLPGWKIPHCHNIIEALLTGCIPITNYSHLMNPPLIHEVNCLAFDSLDDFKRVLKSLATMSEQKKSEIRNNIFDYASRYLEPVAVGSRLISALDLGIEVIAYNDESGN
jgi:hypothetical protein